MKVVDLRREAGYPLSAPLLAALGKLADGGGKAILLLNRRGVAPALHCRACGLTLRCPDCDVSLTLHGDGRLHCHHCGRREPAPELCPACGAAEVARLGAGTERLEEELAERLPGAGAVPARRGRRRASGQARRRSWGASPPRERGRPARARRWSPRATTSRAWRSRRSSTPTPAMGLPDFRAEERTFQLVTQLAGRSGRDAPGRVLVQTYQPDARPIALAARHDVEEFLAGELERRRELGYPPFRHLVRVVVSGPGADRRRRRVLDRAPRRARPCWRRAPTSSARRRSCASAAATARSSWSKTDAPAPRRLARRRACSRRRRRRCAATASPCRSTSTPGRL